MKDKNFVDAYINDELTLKEKEAFEEYDSLRGYSVTYFKGELKLSEADSILFSVFDDPDKVHKAKSRVKRRMILDYNYNKRVGRLNELLTGIEQLKHLESNRN